MQWANKGITIAGKIIAIVFVHPRKIVLLRALPGLGDMLAITPVLAALRAELPGAQISLIGQSWAKHWAFRYAQYFDRFVEFPGFPGMPQGWKSHEIFVQFLTYMVSERFDLALQCHGSGIISNYFVGLLGAKEMAGYYTPGYCCPDNGKFFVWKEEESEVGRYCRLLRSLGIPVADESLIFPMTQKDEQEFAELSESYLKTDKAIACLHPGASTFARICPLEVYSRVAVSLTEMGFQVVLTGTEVEAAITQPIAQMADVGVIDLAGKTTLGSLACLLKKSTLLVCNDTGTSHLADAMKVKSVVIFMENPPSRWAPFDKSLHRIVDVRGWRWDKDSFPVQPIAQKILDEVILLTK